MTETRGTVSTAQDPAAQVATAAPGPKLADPPIPGGRVEAMMGMLIRVLAHSPLARPLPAVSLSALGLGLVAFTGLCATAPATGGSTLPVLLPLTSLAHRLGAPALSALAHQLHHERRPHAVLPGPGRDAVGEQPRLVSGPAEGLLDRGGGGRGPGERHPGRLIGRGELRRVRAHCRPRTQSVRVPAGRPARRPPQSVYRAGRHPVACGPPRYTGRWLPGCTWPRRSWAAAGRG